jgi:hypothetical protein
LPTEGATRFLIFIIIEVIPALLHMSVFSPYQASSYLSLFTIHHTVAYVILSATVVCSLVYAAIITVMPVIFHDSIHVTLLSARFVHLSKANSGCVQHRQ